MQALIFGVCRQYVTGVLWYESRDFRDELNQFIDQRLGD